MTLCTLCEKRAVVVYRYCRRCWVVMNAMSDNRRRLKSEFKRRHWRGKR